METIENHIELNRKILENPTTSPQHRRHIEDELKHLEEYQKNHPEDHHDPTTLEIYCEENPDADECKIYEN